MPNRKQREVEEKPQDGKMFALLWVPKTGLYFEGGAFLDGEDNHIPWSGKVTIFSTFKRAKENRNAVVKKFPKARGSVIIVPVELVFAGERNGQTE